MPSNDAGHATVRHSLLAGKKVPDCLSTLDNVCSAGAQCTEVQGSPVAKQALTALQTAVTGAHGSLTAKQALVQSLMAAIKALSLDFQTVRRALRSYEASVDALADGDASVINKAGLLSRSPKAPATALDKVSAVYSKPGKHPGEAILSWPRGPGATGYAIEVNLTPQSPSGPWTPLPSGSGRRRVVKAPASGAQLLARVASLGSDGSQSDWSDVVLVTAL